MSKFNKGDLVKRVVRGVAKQPVGQIGLVLSCGPDFLKFGDDACSYDVKYYELVRQPKDLVEQDKVPPAGRNKYTFTAPCKKMVRNIEVYENLTREHPLAIAKRDDGFVSVYIHDTIWLKTECMKKRYGKELAKALDDCIYDDRGFFPPEGGALQRIVSAVKAIKLGPLKKGSVPTTVTVELLEI